MAMHNPPHPGEFIAQVYLEPNGLSGRELALKLGVAASTLSRILRAPAARDLRSFELLPAASVVRPDHATRTVRVEPSAG